MKPVVIRSSETGLHGVTSQKMATVISTAVKTSDLDHELALHFNAT
jgi:hypothetical protein